jgi:protease secretion system outer membrane protein
LLSVSFSISAENLTLFKAYEKALDFDPTLNSSYYDNIASQEEVNKTYANFLPQIRLSASQGQSNTESKTPPYPTSTRDYTNYNYSLSVRQPLVNLPNIKMLNQAKVMEDKADTLFEKEKSNLIIRVTGAYLDVLLIQENVNFIHTQIETLQTQLTQSKKLFEIGRGTITDIDENEANLSTLQAKKLELVNAYENAKQELKKITGVFENNFLRLDEQKINIQFIYSKNIRDWIEFSVARNKDIEAAKKDVEIAYLDVQKNDAANYPTVDLVASKSLTESDTNYSIGSRYNTESIGLQMNMPIYSGGYISSSVRQSKAKLEQAEEKLKEKRLFIESNLRKYFDEINNGTAKMKALRQSVASNESALTGAKIGFGVGIKTNVEVLNAVEKLNLAKRDLIKEQYQLIYNVIQFKDLTGDLNSDEIKKISDWLSVPAS